MEDLHFKNEIELKEFLQRATLFPNQGQLGTVYFKNQLVYKVFANTLETYLKKYFNINLPDILQFRDLEIEGIYFPKAGIYVNEGLKGGITEYAEGQEYNSKQYANININVLITALEKLEKCVKEVSDHNIRMIDVNPGNILFNGTQFSIIDTISYRYKRENEVLDADLYYLNMINVMKELISTLLPEILYDYEMPDYMNFFRPMYYTKPVQVMESIYEFYRNLLKTDFQNFTEAKKLIKKRKI